MDSIERLLYFNGVAAEYYNYLGQKCEVPRADRLKLLRLTGKNIDSSEAIEQELFRIDVEPWLHWLRPTYIVTQSHCAVLVSCHPERLAESLQWEIYTEQGEQYTGVFEPIHAIERGEFYIDGVRYSSRELKLDDFPLGYHTLTLKGERGTEKAKLIICPETCYQWDQKGSNPHKIWGISCQLYSLRSSENWGIGDFDDLKKLIKHTAKLGAHLIGLNPLHAPCSSDPAVVSPYSPSDRRFINPVYIAIPKLPEYKTCDKLANFCQSDHNKKTLVQLRHADWVNYEAVTTIKYQALEIAYTDFKKKKNDSADRRMFAFNAFVSQQGESLIHFATFETQTNIYAKKHKDDPMFFCYLQWLASTQLSDCQDYAKDKGMHVGLMGDLAVGSIADGCEVKQNPALFAQHVSIGAPPDPFSSSGQNWGLPAMDPLAMKHNQFQHYIKVLQANMKNRGALRIDHIMSLMRLWWCFPESEITTDRGIYVYYPLQELIKILCLESHRNQCLIIGEDLGVVPNEIREVMNRCGIFGNQLLYFAKDANQKFVAPKDIRENVLYAVTNHDVPTLCDWWASGDILRRYEYGVIKDEETLQVLKVERQQAKHHLLEYLANENLLEDGWQVDSLDRTFDLSLCLSIHLACARSNAKLLLLQLDDLQLLELPINIPSTNNEYPNWRRKQKTTLKNIFSKNAIQAALSKINVERDA